MNQPWMCTCPPFWTPLPPPSPFHPSGSSQCTGPEHPVYALNLEWRSISHMIIYMFKCYSFKSSHSRLLPQSPKVCSLHLCLFCCLKYRVIVTIFLNSIYALIYYICVFLWLASLCIKHLPTKLETRVQSLGWEDLLEKEMAPHSSTLAWKIPWMEEPGRLQTMGSQRVGHNWTTSLSLSLCIIGSSFIHLIRTDSNVFF